MKKILNYLTASTLFLGSLLVQSCNKSDSLNGIEDMDNIEKLADIPLSALSTDTISSYAFDPVSSPTETSDTVIAVHLSSKTHVGNVTFKMGVTPNDSAFTQFLADNPDYELLPSNLYEIPDSNVTIENAGLLNTALFHIKFKTGLIDPSTGGSYYYSHSYLLPLSIVDAGGYKIASNFRMIVMAPLVKNAYDGVYNYVSSANQTLGPNLNKSVELRTVGANTVQIYPGLVASYSNVVTYTIDPSTNLVTVSCPSLGVTNYSDPRSIYDPATKTIKAYWKQGTTRTFEETLTYTGAR